MIWIYIFGVVVVIIGASTFFGAPYLPTRKRDMTRMFDELYRLKSSDVVLDIGSGDGVVLREVSRRGARAVGYEINPVFWGISKLASLNDPAVDIRLTNFWHEPFPDDTTLVYAFSVSRDSAKMVKKLTTERARLKKPLYFVCYGSPLPGIQPVKTFEAFSLYQF